MSFLFRFSWYVVFDGKQIFSLYMYLIEIYLFVFMIIVNNGVSFLWAETPRHDITSEEKWPMKDTTNL